MKRLLRVLDKTGDSRYEFELDNPDSLAAARAAFAEAVRKGGSAFEVKPGSNETTKRINSLDEASQEAIVIPKIVSG